MDLSIPFDDSRARKRVYTCNRSGMYSDNSNIVHGLLITHKMYEQMIEYINKIQDIQQHGWVGEMRTQPTMFWGNNDDSKSNNNTYYLVVDSERGVLKEKTQTHMASLSLYNGGLSTRENVAFERMLLHRAHKQTVVEEMDDDPITYPFSPDDVASQLPEQDRDKWWDVYNHYAESN